MASIENLPANVQQIINTFVDDAKQAFESNLSAIVLYGSAAEGRLRATSDVNMLLVLKHFEQTQADHMREPMRLAHAAAQMNAMFVLETKGLRLCWCIALKQRPHLATPSLGARLILLPGKLPKSFNKIHKFSTNGGNPSSKTG